MSLGKGSGHQKNRHIMHYFGLYYPSGIPEVENVLVENCKAIFSMKNLEL